MVCPFSSSFPSLLKKLCFIVVALSVQHFSGSLFSLVLVTHVTFSVVHNDDFPRLYASLLFETFCITTSRISAARPCLACPSHPPSPPCTFGAERPFPVTHSECTLSVPQRGEDTGKRLAGLFPFGGEHNCPTRRSVATIDILPCSPRRMTISS